MTREELIAALERADGPSRELSRTVARVAGWFRVEPRFHKGGGWIAPCDFLGADADGRPRLDSLHGTDIHKEPPHYTQSLDAALTLVPAGAYWNVLTDGEGDGYQAAAVTEEAAAGGARLTWTKAPTPALALCIAALKARA